MEIINKLLEIKKMLSRESVPKTEILNDILSDKITYEFLFEILLKKEFRFDWFILLYLNNVFDCNNIKDNYCTKNEKGEEIINMPPWHAQWLINKAFNSNKEILNTKKLTDENKALVSILETLLIKYIQWVRVKEKEGKRNSRHDTFYFQLILSLPLECITEEYFQFIVKEGILKGTDDFITHILSTDFYDRVIKHKDAENLKRLLSLFYNSKEKSNSFGLQGYLKGYEMQHILSTVENIWGIIGFESIRILAFKLNELAKASPYEFSRVGIVSIADDEQNSFQDSLNYQIVFLLRDLLIFGNPAEVFEWISKFLFEKGTAIFKRLAINTVNFKYEEYNKLFWQIENPLSIEDSELEIYKLIDTNCEKFTENEQQKMLELIRKYKLKPNKNYTKDENAKYSKYKQLEWLNAFEGKVLSNHVNEGMKNLKEKLNFELKKPKIEHPFYASYVSDLRAGGEYPEEQNRINNLSLDQIIAILSKGDLPNGYDYYGFQNDISITFNKYGFDLVPSLKDLGKLESEYLTSIIGSYENFIEKNLNIDWDLVLEFIIGLIENRKDLQDFSKENKYRSNSFWSNVCWLIKSGARKKCFSNDGLKFAIQITLKIASFYKDEDEQNEGLLNVDRLINSLGGKIYEALVELSIRKFQNFSKEQYWDKNIEAFFNQKLNESNPDKYFYLSVGLYTPNISYFAAEWLEKNVYKIFIDSRELGQGAFRNYVCYSRSVYKNIYISLRGIYGVMLAKINDESMSTQKIVEHICVSHFIFNDSKGNRHFESILQSKRYFQIKALIQHIHASKWYSEHLVEIELLWKRLHDTINSEVESKECQNLNSQLMFWINVFPKLSENIVRLSKQSIEKVNKIDWAFIRDIEKKSKGNEIEIGEILLHCIEKIDNYYFSKEEINKIVKSVYFVGEKKLANKIVEVTIKKKNFELVDLYEEFNTQ